MDVNGQHHALIAFLPGKGPRYPLNRRLGGPHSRSGRFASTGIRNLDHLARSLVTIPTKLSRPIHIYLFMFVCLFVCLFVCGLFIHEVNSTAYVAPNYVTVSNELESAVEPAYNDIGFSDISYITSHVLWYQLIPHC
jgi:hypothetical protein